MSDIERAAQALRDSVAALPSGIRDAPWATYNADKSYAPSHVMARADTGDVLLARISWGDGKAEATHIARTASPDVVTALADLLGQIGADCDDDIEWIVLVEDRANRLAALILRGAL